MWNLLCYLSQTILCQSLTRTLSSSPVSWSKIWSRASHTVSCLVIVLPQNELWARPQKSLIYQSCEKSSIYYWNNVVIVCENANRCGSRGGKILLGKGSHGGFHGCQEGEWGVCVCAQTHIHVESGRGCGSIWWMGMCLNTILVTNCSLTHSFLMTGHFWPGTPQVYKG